MSDHTKIEWADATVNAVNGCSLASPGCTNCYAMRLAGTRMKSHPSRAGLTMETKAGPVWTGEVRLSETALLQPLRWKRPRRIFWNAHGDLFHDNVPDEWIDRVFAVCALTPQHTHMVLTKRSARMLEYFAALVGRGDPFAEAADEIADFLGMKDHPAVPEPRDFPLPNVWLGVSVEDQARADERIPDLLATPAAVRFISAEPLLGPVGLNELGVRRECTHEDAYVEWDTNACICSDCEAEPLLDWVIVGGESGPGARPMHPDWARSLRDQCAAAGVAFHFKQWGEWAAFEIDPNGRLDPPMNARAANLWRRWDGAECRTAHKGEYVSTFLAPGTFAAPIGKKAAGRLLDGVEHNGVPA